jgi:hypothetical protein
MKVIVDTNALMVPAQFRVDIFSELQRLGYDEILVPKAVVNELERLSKVDSKTRIAASIALSLLDRCKIVDVNGNADDVIVKLAKEEGAAVFTNDAGLRKRLPAGRTVCLRERKYIDKG